MMASKVEKGFLLLSSQNGGRKTKKKSSGPAAIFISVRFCMRGSQKKEMHHISLDASDVCFHENVENENRSLVWFFLLLFHGEEMLQELFKRMRQEARRLTFVSHVLAMRDERW
jgi:hypothetical protein